MLLRVGLAVTCSLVAFTVSVLKNNNNRSVLAEEKGPSGKEEEEAAQHGEEGFSSAYGAFDDSTQQETLEEEVKRVIPDSPARTSVQSASDYGSHDLLLPEFEDLLSAGELTADFSQEFSDGADHNSRGHYHHDADLAKDADELQLLRSMVKELRERELRMEGELLEFYALQLQESNVAELERGLQDKTVQNEKLRLQIRDLELQGKKLVDELASVSKLKKDLDEERANNRELQKQIHSHAGNAKAELLMMKQKLLLLETKEEDGRKKREFDLERKLQSLHELEVEIVELRRTNKELQHQKRELAIKLNAVEAEVQHLINRTESDLVAEAEARTAAVRHANEDLAKQVEGLQMDRFSEVEELVYLRWVNACLRYELRNYTAPAGKTTALDLSNNLSPRSQERAKKLMLKYAAPDLLAISTKDQAENGYESASSETSSRSEGGPSEYNDSPLDLGPGGMTNKKPSLIRRLKNWTVKKDDGLDLSGARSLQDRERSFSSLSDPTHGRKYSASKPPLEALILRNASDAVEITSYGAKKPDKQDLGSASPTMSVSDSSSIDGGNDAAAATSDTLPNSQSNLPPLVRKKSAGDVFSGVAASFQLMSKSVAPEIAEKYPAFKDRHKAAIEREKVIKEKAKVEREKAINTKPHERVHFRIHEMPKLQQIPARKRVEAIKLLTPAEVEKRPLRVATPPPKPSDPVVGLATGSHIHRGPGVTPPPPPPPPPRPGVHGAPPLPPPPPPMGGGLGNLQGKNKDNMHRAPEVVEFYQSLMKRDVKSTGGGISGNDINPDARNKMIGEIENRSTHLLAIKADVETQGEFVQSLAAAVRTAFYTNIEDVIAFVTWLDNELSFLVDERAVLKHFDWPEGKADAFREASFEYQDLMKLHSEVSLFEDDPGMPCEKALQRMLTTLEKVEHNIYGLLRTRDMAIARYKEFGIPTQWMLDSGVVGKIKVASVKLARVYMTRVAAELEHLAGSDREPVCEFLLLQGVRFAFRVHQFAGGFDPESMRAFEALRDCAHVSNKSATTTDVGDVG
ncbi:unnamed protein product [Sphagnum troendelagicum]|uniref:Protein CHUP1, chloroplastic n=1 Tax=Sphagnum troendelagicum TaxID=128251 RepID=A0ABP0UV09_9BRYO